MKRDFCQTGPTPQGVEIAGQAGRMEGITELVDEHILGQGVLVALLHPYDHGGTMVTEDLSRPPI